MLTSGGLLDVALSLLSVALEEDPDLHDFDTTKSATGTGAWRPESRFEPRKDADDVVEASFWPKPTHTFLPTFRVHLLTPWKP